MPYSVTTPLDIQKCAGAEIAIEQQRATSSTTNAKRLRLFFDGTALPTSLMNSAVSGLLYITKGIMVSAGNFFFGNNTIYGVSAAAGSLIAVGTASSKNITFQLETSTATDYDIVFGLNVTVKT
jgi:hypothetical protein